MAKSRSGRSPRSSSKSVASPSHTGARTDDRPWNPASAGSSRPTRRTWNPASAGLSAALPLRWIALAIGVGALIIRLLYLWQIRRAPFFTVLMGDSKGYDAWARQIAAGDWIGHDVFYQAPLYPYFLGFIYSVAGHNVLAVRIAQSCLGALSCVLIAHAAWRLFSTRAAIIAGFVMALYPSAIFFDGLLQKTALDAFFTSVALWIISGMLSAAATTGAWFGLGITMGALSLTRENALALVVLLLGWCLFGAPGTGSVRLKPDPTAEPKNAEPQNPEPSNPERRNLEPRNLAPSTQNPAPNSSQAPPLTRRVVHAAAFLVGLSLLLLPVAIRNYAVGGGFYLTTSQFGPNLFLGNNARTDGTAGSLIAGRGSVEYERQDAIDIAERAAGHPLTPAEVSSYWTGQTLAFIRSSPWAWTKLMIRKVVLLWNRSEAFDTESQESYAEWSPLLRAGNLIGHFGVLVPLAFLGIFATWADRRRLAILYAIVLVYGASVVLFFIYARYRYPLVPFLMLFAAAGLAALPDFVRRMTPSRRWQLALAIALVAVFTNWPALSATGNRAVTEHNLGAALQTEGQLDAAIVHYRRAIAINPDYAPSYSNLGAALLATGQTADAITAYQRALAIDPDFTDAQFNLGNAFLRQERYKDAIAQFQRIVQRSPTAVDARTNLGVALVADGRLDEGIAELETAVRLAPRSAETQRALGEALGNRGRFDEAVDHLRQATVLAPSDGQAYYALGHVLLQQQRPSEAAAQLQRAAELPPVPVEVLNELGVAFASTGRIDDAIAQFRLAIQREPNFAEAQQNLRAALAEQQRRPR
jgi:tetratricopeptide (TPR) repeat protein